MLSEQVNNIIYKFRNPLLELPFHERKTTDNLFTYNNYNRLRNLLYFMSGFALILLTLDFIYFDEWSKNNLIILFFIADVILVVASITGIILINKNRTPSIHFQKRVINTYILIGALWTGIISGQDYEQNAITLVAGVFILSGGFTMRGKFHLLILLALYTSYTLMHLFTETENHDPITDFAIIPPTMAIAWIYGKIMFNNKFESIQQALKLQAYSNELQSTIEKRTAELKAKNSSLMKEISNKEFIQNQLIASEELFKAILFQSPDLVAIFKIGGEIIQWNPKAEEYSGIPADKLLGRNIWDLFLRISADNEDNFNLKSQVKEFVTQVTQNPTHNSVLKVKHWITQSKDSKRYMESKLFPIHLHDKTLIAAVSRNITKQLENEQKLEAAMQDAEKANEAKSNFLANVSHDLRSPLNSISGFSQLLKLKPDLNKEKQKKYLSIIYDNGQFLLQLINSLIDLSKLQTGNIKVENSEIDLAELMQEINSIIESEKTLYAPQIKLKGACDFKSHYIIGDRTKIMQIFTNLLSNAIKFTQKGMVTYQCNIINDRLIGIVSDTGIGMDSNEVEQIFDRFYSVHKENNIHRKGKGLGLAIVKGYIELLNGEIRVESEKGKGSTFEFSIPVKEISTHQTINKQLQIKKNSKILISDSDNESFEFIKEILESYSIHIETTEILRGLSDKIDVYKPDLLLIDIQANYAEYKKYVRIIKEKNPDLPIIAYTALSQTELPNDLSILFDIIIFKPINVDSLIQKIADQL
jgi:PAS domain S-box-containing protein